jgi:tetratricopeptide (TPR) repeat protein
MEGMDRIDKKRIGRLFRIALLAIFALCAACGGDREPPPPQKPVAEKPAAQTRPAQAVEAAPKVEPRPAAVPQEQIASYRSLLRDGRTRVRDKEYAAGIASYERALALRPGDPRLLVELGWAAFLDGDLERAAQATRQGLLGTREDKAKGAALYNLGRIAEKRGQKAEAADLYRESLAVRPNAIVEKRLNGLGVETAAAAASPEAPSELGPLEGPFPSLEAVCAALVPDFAGEGGRVGCAKDDVQQLEIGQGPLVRALLLPMWRSYFDVGGPEDAAEVARYLVVETSKGFYRTRTWVSFVYNPGAFGIFEEIESALELRDLVPGAPPEIVMRAVHRRHDSDLGILEEESEETEWLLVCGLVEGAPRCLAKIPTSYSYERGVMDLGDTDPGEPIEHTPGLPIRSSYGFEVGFDGKGGYTLKEAAPPVGDAAAEAGVRAGTFKL